MLVLKHIEEVDNFITKAKKEKRSIGFVPTMGALHQGHLSLVKKAIEDTDIVVVSIFVNPTQFNDPNDLKNYPRTLKADLSLLRPLGVNAVFCPEVSTIYPEKDERTFDVGQVAEVMEGQYRPGHFLGVIQVVSKLFDIVKPDKAFFGEKDFQQIAVIRAMLKITKQPVEIISCPIFRAENGLALSSRNTLLDSKQLSIAPQIYQTLQESIKKYPESSPKEVIHYVTDIINSIDGLQVEYFDIVDADSLQSVSTWDEATAIQGCITVYCGKIRLIDNIKYK